VSHGVVLLYDARVRAVRDLKRLEILDHRLVVPRARQPERGRKVEEHDRHLDPLANVFGDVVVEVRREHHRVAPLLVDDLVDAPLHRRQVRRVEFVPLGEVRDMVVVCAREGSIHHPQSGALFAARQINQTPRDAQSPANFQSSSPSRREEKPNPWSVATVLWCGCAATCGSQPASRIASASGTNGCKSPRVPMAMMSGRRLGAMTLQHGRRSAQAQPGSWTW
jgi:hypothetical protein